MKMSTKAVLLSTFVFPGAGHLLLKKYVTGLSLAGIAFAGIYYATSKTLESAMQIVEQIQSGDIQPDVTTITQLAADQSTGADAWLLNMATLAFVICWLIGIIDSYRVGRVRDRNGQGTSG